MANNMGKTVFPTVDPAFVVFASTLIATLKKSAAKVTKDLLNYQFIALGLQMEFYIFSTIEDGNCDASIKMEFIFKKAIKFCLFRSKFAHHF